VSLARRAMHAALWSALESVGVQLTSFLLFLAFARLISPTSIGVVQIATTLLTFLAIFVEHSFSSRIIRAPSVGPEMLSTAFWLGLSGAVALAITLTFGGDVIASWYRTPDVAPVLRTLAWCIPLTTLSAVQTALLIRDIAFRTQAIRRLIAVSTGGVVGLALAFNGFGVWSLVARLAVESFLDCVLAWWLMDWRPAWLVSRTEAMAFLSFGSRIVGGFAIGFMGKRADELLIGLVLGSTSLGYFAVAARAMSLVTEVALRAVQRTAVPVFSRLQDQPERLRRVVYSGVEFASAVACPVLIGMSAIAPELCRTLYGNAWEPVIPVMRILGFSGAAVSLSLYTTPLMIAVGRPGWLFRYYLAEALINLVTAALVVRHGIIAVAIAFVVRSYLTLPLTIALANRTIGTTWFELLRLIARPLASSLLMFIAVHYARRVLPLSQVPMLFTLICAGALVYMLAMFLIGRDTLRRFYALMQELRRRPGTPGSIP
jgi:O-antigen/teichoic acid export membrane protein